MASTNARSRTSRLETRERGETTRANITVRKEAQAPIVAPEAPSLFADWPRMRTLLAPWDPFREMLPIVQSMPADFLPAFEVKENGQGFVFKADLPGMKEADLQVAVNGDRLTVFHRGRSGTVFAGMAWRLLLTKPPIGRIAAMTSPRGASLWRLHKPIKSTLTRAQHPGPAGRARARAGLCSGSTS